MIKKINKQEKKVTRKRKHARRDSNLHPTIAKKLSSRNSSPQHRQFFRKIIGTEHLRLRAAILVSYVPSFALGQEPMSPAWG